MAVAANNIIDKSETLDIFKTNLLTAIFSGVKGINNMPRFVGTAGSFTNPVAIPTNQLDNTTKPSASLSDIVCQAGNTYRAFKNIIDNLTRIRYFTSNWYFQTNSTLGLVNTQSGTAIFLARIPGLTPYSTTTMIDGTSGWTRTITGTGSQVGSTGTAPLTSTLNVENTLKENDIISVSKVTPYTLNTALFKKLYDAWASNRNNRITYNYYTCHSNCHSNWVNTRSRR